MWRAESEQYELEKAAETPVACSTQTYHKLSNVWHAAPRIKNMMCTFGEWKQRENNVTEGCLAKADCLMSCSLPCWACTKSTHTPTWFQPSKYSAQGNNVRNWWLFARTLKKQLAKSLPCIPVEDTLQHLLSINFLAARHKYHNIV